MKNIHLSAIGLLLILASCGSRQSETKGEYLNNTSSDLNKINVIVGRPQSMRAFGGNNDRLLDSRTHYVLNSESSLLFYPGQFIVTSAGREDLEGLLKKYNGKLLSDGEIPPAPSIIPTSELRTVNTPRHQLIELDSPDVSIEEFKTALGQLSIRGDVYVSSQRAMNDFVQLQRLRQDTHLNAEPNLMAFSMANIDAPEQNGTFTARNNWGLNTPAPGRDGLNVEQAWQNGYTGFGVQVAIIDVGFVKEDYELNGYNPKTGNTQKWVSGYNFTAGAADPYTSVTSSDGDPDPNKSIWHGYSAAQSAVGANDNAYGTSGVAPDANAFLFRLGQSSVPGAEGALSYYDASRAVDTAVAWGADVINMSFGVRTPGAFGVPNSYLASALANAEAAGLINVAAAGNESAWVGTTKWIWDLFPIPASWDSVISVGAVERDLTRTSYSNWGPGVQIYGPGYSLLAPSPKICMSYFADRCANSGEIYIFNGTSNASPFIAGTVALMKQAKPSITTQQARNLLVATAKKNSAGEDVANVWAAVDAARQLP